MSNHKIHPRRHIKFLVTRLLELYETQERELSNEQEQNERNRKYVDIGFRQMAEAFREYGHDHTVGVAYHVIIKLSDRRIGLRVTSDPRTAPLGSTRFRKQILSALQLDESYPLEMTISYVGRVRRYSPEESADFVINTCKLYVYRYNKMYDVDVLPARALEYTATDVIELADLERQSETDNQVGYIDEDGNLQWWFFGQE